MLETLISEYALNELDIKSEKLFDILKEAKIQKKVHM